MPPAAPLSPLVGSVVLPGDSVLSLADVAASSAAGGAAGTPSVRLGPSLLQSDGEVRAIRLGTLRQTGGGKLWLETSHRRYLPAVEDAVVGLVVERHAENFVVDICGPFKAALPVLAFENATRRNRPNLDVGSLVYARVESAPRDADPQLSCVDAAGKASGMGPLLGGLPFTVSTGGARLLLARPPCAALAALGAAVAFELVVGANGRCWVSAADVATTVLVVNALQQAVERTPEQGVTLVAALLAAHADNKGS